MQKDETLRLLEIKLRGYFLQGLSGDDVSYHGFLYEISKYLRSFFRRRLTHLPNEVEDLVQESLLAIHNQRHTYDADRPLTAWVYAIARYKLVDMLRRRAVHDAVTIPLDDDADLFYTADDSSQEAHRDILVLLEQLPENLRLPILHTKIKGLSIAEAAQITGMSVSAVKVGVHRGLRLLASKMRKELGDS